MNQDEADERPDAPVANAGCLSTVGVLFAVTALLLLATLPHVGILAGGVLGFLGAIASGLGIASAVAQHRALVRRMPWARSGGGPMVIGGLAMLGNLIALALGIAFVAA